MLSDILNNRDFGSEFTFVISRSSGPGGQNVNKVNTKVELRFHVNSSALLTENEKEIINQKLVNKINNDGFLILTSQTERTQLANKNKVIEKFYNIIEKALKPVKKRIPSKPSKAAIEKRLVEKRKQAEKKAMKDVANGLCLCDF